LLNIFVVHKFLVFRHFFFKNANGLIFLFNLLFCFYIAVVLFARLRFAKVYKIAIMNSFWC